VLKQIAKHLIGGVTVGSPKVQSVYEASEPDRYDGDY
jgi:hypothetical protein